TKYNVLKSELNIKNKRISENPFDSDRKLMSTLNIEGSSYKVHTKGAIDNLLKIADKALVGGEVIALSKEIKEQFIKAAEAMSDSALRVLGVAYKDTADVLEPQDMEKDLILIGMVGMIDPPRMEVKDSIKEAKTAGITPIMITGDHKNTAVAIAKELGIASSIEQSLTGAEIDQLTDAEFSRDIKKYRVFARVSPEHKVKIVRAFKAQNNIVSMTGDGVNDAPSLKYADIGVAMGITGTDVSKGASDMILTDDNFTTIVHAIEEGRNIYNNIKKSVIFLLSCNLGEVISIFASILFFWPVPLMPTQILWINLITDTLPAIALGVDPGDKDVMRRKPRNPKESFFAQGAGVRAVIGGTLIGILTLLAFYFGLKEHGYSMTSASIPDEVLTYARTMAFIVLATSQLFFSFTMRNSLKSIFKVGLFSNKFLVVSFIVGFLLQVMVVSTPLSYAFNMCNLTFKDWDLVIIFSIIPLIINEIIKSFRRIKERKEEEEF
ncbi:MAG: cation-translocating P-type ATPase, partial [Eubacteriaceae bacterium]|nr:cation-translocating P-type ATPase [Eubacteriaceae bacterium]